MARIGHPRAGRAKAAAAKTDRPHRRRARRSRQSRVARRVSRTAGTHVPDAPRRFSRPGVFARSASPPGRGERAPDSSRRAGRAGGEPAVTPRTAVPRAASRGTHCRHRPGRFGRRPVAGQERAGGRRRGDGEAGGRVRPRRERNGCERDDRLSGREPVDAVHEVEEVRDADEPGHGEGRPRWPSGRSMGEGSGSRSIPPSEPTSHTAAAV